MTSAEPDNEYARLLGAALRGHRMARGLSLRGLARRIGLSGHGTLVDYEYGRRIPPYDIVVACERVLDVRDDQLRDLREKALADRADRAASVLLDPPPGTASGPEVPEVPDEPAAPPEGSGRRGRARLLLPLAALLAIAVALGVFAAIRQVTGHAAATPGTPRPAGPVRSAAATAQAGGPPVRVGFERDADDWAMFYGGQVGQETVTGSVAYEGSHALMVTVAGASESKGYSAVGTTHGLTGLRPGMRVTFHLWVPGPQPGGVRFFAYDSRSKPHWARETGETQIPLPGRAGWTAVTWTVPAVDRVHAIGMEIWSENDRPLVVALDGIAW